MILVALLLSIMGSGPRAPRPAPAPNTIAEVFRPQFDLVVVYGADFAFLSPDTGTERVEQGIDLGGGPAAAGDGSAIVFRVDPDTDYTCTALVDWPDHAPDDWRIDGRRDVYIVELPRTRQLVLEWFVYTRIRAERRLAQTIKDLDSTDDELARALQRMTARVDSEGNSSD